MEKQDQSLFQEEIRRFFSTRFPAFKYYEPAGAGVNFAYYLNHLDPKLSIVISLPLRKDEAGRIKMTDRRIGIILKPTGTDKGTGSIELVDTIIDGTWPERLHDRINCLRELIAEIYSCPVCGQYPFPQLCRTNDQKRTLFVALRCPDCHRYTSTTYGIGLKTRLHRDLKRRLPPVFSNQEGKEKKTSRAIQVFFLMTKTNGFKETSLKILSVPPGYAGMNVGEKHAFAAEMLKNEELEKYGAGPEGEEPNIEIIKIDPA